MKRGSHKPDHAMCMTRAEVGALLFTAKNVLGDWRSYYLITLQYLLGLRVGEVIKLRYEHLDPRRDRFGDPIIVWVPTEKKGELAKSRSRICQATGLPLFSVPVLSHGALIAAAFNRALRPTKEERESPWILPSLQSAKRFMARRTAIQKFDLAKSAGYLNDAYTSHTLRHTAATRLYEKCNTTRIVAEFLRHDRTGGRGAEGATTNRYIHITTEQWMKYRGCFDLPLPLRPLA